VDEHLYLLEDLKDSLANNNYEAKKKKKKRNKQRIVKERRWDKQRINDCTLHHYQIVFSSCLCPYV
jgi:hypothetical protein